MTPHIGNPGGQVCSPSCPACHETVVEALWNAQQYIAKLQSQYAKLQSEFHDHLRNCPPTLFIETDAWAMGNLRGRIQDLEAEIRTLKGEAP